ncbi:hypothetical protein GRI39_05820 [Altererythrobacter indicus]|uniref:Phage shock protein B n=1 Tax=Altericroceibacterium indicum TaxID=374177 RepID=A0A845A8A6_9SPHN|nr:hypothetical protein [Altericroceibacterium indicum]MXP25559.1 hypothetical protein [Altericroceibacterium indicum]
MNLWTTILLIAIAGMIYSAWRSKHLTSNGITEDFLGNQSLDDHRANAELQREVEELRERVQILERIVTDGREASRISSEIEKLRH